jgi:hypothetical protein
MAKLPRISGAKAVQAFGGNTLGAGLLKAQIEAAGITLDQFIEK